MVGKQPRHPTAVERARPTQLEPTGILDCDHPAIQRLAVELAASGLRDRAFLQAAHLDLVGRLRAVHSLDEWRRASVTLRAGAGSCSQRLACLEAVARAHGIGTRVNGLWLDGRRWYGALGGTGLLRPRRALLLWPQFLLDEGWVDVDELHGSAAELASRASAGLPRDRERLFEALAVMPVDLTGKTRGPGGTSSRWDLADLVLGGAGVADRRDDLLRRLGSPRDTWRGRLFSRLYGGRLAGPDEGLRRG